MKLRIKRTERRYIGHQPTSWKVQRRICFIWFDCVDGVDGNPYVPTFERYQAAEMFGMHYAKIRNDKAEFIE